MLAGKCVVVTSHKGQGVLRPGDGFIQTGKGTIRAGQGF